MRFNPKARLDTSRTSDAGRGTGGTGGGMGIPIPAGGAGGGIGVILMIALVVLSQCMGSGQTTAGPSNAPDTARIAPGDSGRYGDCKYGEDANANPDCERIAVENSLYDYWKATLPAESGTPFQPASLATFSGSVGTGCGGATSQVGPFYCPSDLTIYMDTSFFDDVLERQLGGPDGGFVQSYVLAHEYGHHIQRLLGTMSRVRTQQGPRSDAVRLELQADCYAGMWAKAATRTQDADGNTLITELTQDDITLAIQAAEAVGDDRIQQKTQGQVTQESWTHGSAASRVKWFQVGLTKGTVKSCDTWAVDTP
ncbi:MAG: KPN_02809 family neutral zinc metallopeptidase [Nocardioides sp.]